MRTEWVIHIWGKEREELKLTPQEKFHIDMIERYDHSIFDKVLINIAMHDINDVSLFGFLKNELLNVFSDVKEVEIKKCQNDRMLCEYVTFRPYVWDRIGEDVRIFYSHFKGYISNIKLLNEQYPKRNLIISEYYWSYLMYRMSLGDEYIREMIESFNDGKCIYCWCLFDKSNLEYLYTSDDGDFYDLHFRNIEDNIPYIKNFYINEKIKIHSPGSFVWYDMNNIYNHIGEYNYKMISVDDEILKNIGAATYFCELYIWRFLKLESIQEQTFINNISGQFYNAMNNPYTQIYCSKKICKEYIQDFDRYIIKNKLI